jgi:type IV secretory pathway VirB10-like protein
VGITELSNALGIDKSVVSRLVKKGMPTTSTTAAQAWRETHAPPRAKRGQRGTPPPPPKLPKVAAAPKAAEPPPKPSPPPKVSNDTASRHADPEPDDEDNTPRQSLRRARLAEKVGYNELVLCKRNGGSIEDIRKANSTYIAARNNRFKAERDFKEWQRLESITLFLDEAREIYGRPHQAERQILETMPKTLAPRLVNQSQKSIETALVEWVDRLMELRRNSI